MRVLKRVLFLAVVTLFLMSAPAPVDALQCDGSELCPGVCSGGQCITGGSTVWVCKQQTGSSCNQYWCKWCDS